MRVESRWSVYFLVLASVCLAGANCDEEDPPGDGFLLVTAMVTDLARTDLEDFRSVSVDVERVDVVYRSSCDDSSTEEIRTVSSESTVFSLSPIGGRSPRLVARFPIAPGCVMQVRMISGDVTVVVGEETLVGWVPSGPQTGLKITPGEDEPPFEIQSGRTTTIRVDYDPNHQLVINRGQGLLHKPTLHAYLVDDEFPLGFILNEVVLTFPPGVSDGDIEGVVDHCGGEIVRHYPRHFVTVELPPTGEERQAVECYATDERVRSAMPNMIVETQGPNPFTGTPDDPHYNDVPPDGFEALNLGSVNAPEAWEVTTGDHSVVVAVVDTGFDVLHEELLMNIWINEGEIPDDVRDEIVDVGANGITFFDLNHPDNDGICPKENSEPFDICDPLDLVNGDCPGGVCVGGYGWQDGNDGADDNGFIDDLIGWDFGEMDNLPDPSDTAPVPWHGTGVAGVALGAGNNGAGGIGVAWNAALMMVAGSVLANPPGVPDTASIPARLRRDDHVRGVHYALTNGAQVINSSVGSLIFREDVDYLDICTLEDGSQRGIRFVPTDKYDLGLQALEEEWETIIGPYQDRAVLTVAVGNCGGVSPAFEEYTNVDSEGHYFWPGGYTVERPEHGLSYVHRTMISVTNSVHHSLLPAELGGGVPTSEPAPHPDTVNSTNTVLIAAPGTGWRVPLAREYPVTGIGTDYTDCDNTADYRYCEGTSLAAPMVAGAVALLIAEYPGMTPEEWRGLILDRASRPVSDISGELIFGRKAEEGRLLDISAAILP